jgi:hypothetical protein
LFMYDDDMNNSHYNSYPMMSPMMYGGMFGMGMGGMGMGGMGDSSLMRWLYAINGSMYSIGKKHQRKAIKITRRKINELN